MKANERQALGERLAKAAGLPLPGDCVQVAPGEEWLARSFAAWLEPHVLPVCRERREGFDWRVYAMGADICAETVDPEGDVYFGQGDTIHEALALACAEFLEKTAPPLKRTVVMPFWGALDEGVTKRMSDMDGNVFAITLEPKP